MPDSCPARFTKCQKVALMIATAKGERRYRYYVSRRLVTGIMLDLTPAPQSCAMFPAMNIRSPRTQDHPTDDACLSLTGSFRTRRPARPIWTNQRWPKGV